MKNIEIKTEWHNNKTNTVKNLSSQHFQKIDSAPEDKDDNSKNYLIPPVIMNREA